jgi:hypothetical protein
MHLLKADKSSKVVQRPGFLVPYGGSCCPAGTPFAGTYAATTPIATPAVRIFLIRRVTSSLTSFSCRLADSTFMLPADVWSADHQRIVSFYFINMRRHFQLGLFSLTPDSRRDRHKQRWCFRL